MHVKKVTTSKILAQNKVMWVKKGMWQDALLRQVYQLPRILNGFCMLPDKRCLSHGMCHYQVMMTLHFLNDITYDAESTKNRKLVIIASLKSETMGKLIK